jgi:hypothetical protein
MPAVDVVWAVSALWRAPVTGDDGTAYRIAGLLAMLVSLQTSLDSYVAFEKYLLVRQGVLESVIVRGMSRSRSRGQRQARRTVLTVCGRDRRVGMVPTLSPPRAPRYVLVTHLAAGRVIAVGVVLHQHVPDPTAATRAPGRHSSSAEQITVPEPWCELAV